MQLPRLGFRKHFNKYYFVQTTFNTITCENNKKINKNNLFSFSLVRVRMSVDGHSVSKTNF